jgi:hypothetical protein
MTTRRALLPLLLALTLLAPSAAAAPSDHSPALLQALRAIDIVPPAEALRAAVPDQPVEDALFAVATDQAMGLYVRKRATSLLSLFAGGSLAAGHLQTLAHGGGAQSQDLRWTATYTFVRAMAERAPADSLALAAEAASWPEPLLREAAVRGLRWVPGPDAVAIVDALDARETDPRVRGAIQRFRATR